MSFREDVVTQAAGVLIRREGGKMNYMKLLKLLYLADRKSLIEATKTISGDMLVAMDNGPLLSTTYDLIKKSDEGEREGYWCSHLHTDGYIVEISNDIEVEDLSGADERRLNEIYDEFGCMTEFELVEWTHLNLHEWSDPHGSSREIPTREIFFAAKVEGTRAFDREISEEAIRSKERKLHGQFVFEKAVGL
jgi:uncharacterized phage-associated protein